MKFAEEGRYGDSIDVNTGLICHKCSSDIKIPYGDLYGGVSKKQLLDHFSEEDLIEIIGIEKIEAYLRKKKLEKIRKK